MIHIKEFNIDLPKWPALFVSGKRVTGDQAAEIIIRTSNMNFGCNNRDFDRKLYQKLGAEINEYGFLEWEDQNRLIEKYKCLSVEYLNNSGRISTSYVGGPHGWINWNGDIFCNSYNIGKWPSVGEIFEEWCTIAEAFPFLDLISQLFDGEQCEDIIKPIVQFRVKNGNVDIYEPSVTNIPIVHDWNPISFLDPNFGIGCTVEQFEEALKIVEKSNAD